MIHIDDDFDFETAKGDFSSQNEFGYVRVEEMASNENDTQGQKTTVFSNGVSAGDIKQGSLGDCYLLSAMSIIAHSRPELI